MSLKVKLADVVEHMSLMSDEIAVYLNKRTGEFVVLPSDDNLGLEDEDDYAKAERGAIDNDWLGEQDEEYQEQYKLRREIIKSRDYIPLPDRFEIHEWQIMDDFCRTQKDPRVKDEMLALIRRRGAFGRFHSAIQGFELESLWYEFREAALSEIAVEWLDANQIEFVPLANAAVSNSSIETN